MSLGARGRDDGRAEGLAEVDRSRADPRRAAVHEQDLAGLQGAAVEHIGPNGEGGLRDRRRLDGRQAARDRQGVRLVDGAELGIASPGNEGGDPVALAMAGNAGPERGDCPRDLQAEDVARARRGRVEAEALQHVRPVDPGRLDLDQDLARLRDRARALDEGQDLGAAGTGGDDRAHGFERFSHRVSPLCLRFS